MEMRCAYFLITLSKTSQRSLIGCDTFLQAFNRFCVTLSDAVGSLGQKINKSIKNGQLTSNIVTF